VTQSAIDISSGIVFAFGMTNTTRALALLALLLSVGCAPPPLATEPEVPLSRRAVVEFGGSWSPKRSERRELLRLLDLAERAFLHLDPGAPPRVRRVVLWDSSRLPRSLTRPLELSGASSYLGLCLWGNMHGAEVHLATGGRFPMGAAVHELRHAKRHDPDHELPRWKTYNAAGRGVSLVPKRLP